MEFPMSKPWDFVISLSKAQNPVIQRFIRIHAWFAQDFSYVQSIVFYYSVLNA